MKIIYFNVNCYFSAMHLRNYLVFYESKKLCQSLYNMSTEHRNNKLIQDEPKIVKECLLFKSTIPYNKYYVGSNVEDKVNHHLKTFLIYPPCFGSLSRGELILGFVAKMWGRGEDQVGEDHQAQDRHQGSPPAPGSRPDHGQHWQMRVGGGPWLFQESLHPDNREPGNIWK